MIVVITRRSYDAVVALDNGPIVHGDALLTRDFATVRIPDELGRALMEIYPNSEMAIRMLLEDR